MFQSENKIIIVDDNTEHLQILGKPFIDSGIGCKLCKYDSLRRKPFSGVRVAFFDINLNPAAGGGDEAKFSKLSEALKQYVHKDNGPYALIFWTSHGEDIDNFKKYMNERHPDYPKPFLVDYIDKSEFLVGGNAGLKAKLKKVLGDKTLEILYNFENITSKSAANTINQLYNIIPRTDTWGTTTSYKENFEKIFSKIASSTLGFRHAKGNPDKAVYEALLPMLNHQVLVLNKSKEWNETLTSLRAATKLSDIKSPAGFREGELNSIFHIDNSGLKKDIRGAVLRMNKSKTQIRESFGYSFEEWLRSFVPFKQAEEFKANERDNNVAAINALISTTRLVAIEISAACDYQQNKNRLNKYLFGVLIDRIQDGLLRKEKPEHSMKAGVFYLNGKEFETWVNLNYVFGALPSDKRLGNPLFIFKKEMMDMIGNRYANHISRIGITSFF